MKFITCVAYILTVLGGLNWGLIGFFHINLVVRIFGNAASISQLIYCLVGLSAVWMIFTANKCFKS